MSVHCCRALRAILDESFHGPYLGPFNKYFNILICAFISVHCHRPNARAATPPQGVALSLQQKTGAQCGAYGWWQEDQKHPDDEQQHVGQPVADHKAIWKLSPFHEIKPANVRLSHSSWQADSGNVPHYHTVHSRWDHVLEGSAHLTMGDTRGDIKAQDQFPPKSDKPDIEGTTSSLSQKSGHLKNKGATDEADRGNELTLCSETICCARGTEHYQGAKSTKLCSKYMVHWTLQMCLGHSRAEVPHNLVLDHTRSDLFIFYHSFALLPHSKSELGYYYFLCI